jgi:hypothetical protein
MVEWVKEVERDSWASFKTRRSTAHAKQLLASPAARRGGAGRGTARGGERRARALEGTWRGEERRGGS